jgi:hypothetical protein
LALAVSIGVVIFYSSDIDVRFMEAEIMNSKINDCLIKNGFIIEDFNNFDILDKCNIDKIVDEEGSDFFARIDFEDGEGNILRESIFLGDRSREKECDFNKEGIEGKDFGKCYQNERSFYYTDGVGVLKILTLSSQVGQNE